MIAVIVLGSLQVLAITLCVWVIIIILTFRKLWGRPIEAITNEVPKLLILAFSAASTTTLVITVAISMVAPQLLQDPTAALYATGAIGAAISIWWTYAVYWREIKLASKIGSEKTGLDYEASTPKQVDYVAIAQSWVKGRLTGIEISTWASSPAKDDGKGNIEVSGVATPDKIGWPSFHMYCVRMTKDGRILEDSYVS